MKKTLIVVYAVFAVCVVLAFFFCFRGPRQSETAKQARETLLSKNWTQFSSKWRGRTVVHPEVEKVAKKLLEAVAKNDLPIRTKVKRVKLLYPYWILYTAEDGTSFTVYFNQDFYTLDKNDKNDFYAFGLTHEELEPYLIILYDMKID